MHERSERKPLYTIHLEFFSRGEIVDYLRERYPGIILWETQTGYDAMWPSNESIALFPIQLDEYFTP